MAPKDTDKAPASNGNGNSVFLAMWRDRDGKPRAFGIDSDRNAAKKKADKDRFKFEKKEGNPELERMTVQTVTLT